MSALQPGPSAARTLLPVAGPRETARLAWRLVRTRKAALALAVVAVALVGAAGVVAPWMLGDVVDAVQTGAGSGAVYRSAGLIALAAIVGGLCTALSAAALAQAAAPALAELREDVLDRALHLDSAELEAAGSGDLLSRVGGDVGRLTAALDSALPLLVNSVVAVGFTGVGLFALDWRLGVAGLLAVPLYALALRWYLPRSAPLYRRERTLEGERAQAVVTGLHGAATLRTFGLEQRAVDEISARSTASMAVSVRVFDLMTRLFGRINRAEFIGLALVLVTGFLLVRAGQVSVGAATAAALFFHRLFNPIGAILLVFDQIQSAGASLARLAGVALLPPPADPQPLRLDPEAGLQVTAVSHGYEQGRLVLEDVDLALAPGDRVALVGATGAGKTTLAGIVAGQLHASTGTVSLGGIAYADLDEPTVRRHVALVSQEVHVFAGTVADNLRLARHTASDDALWQALEATRSAGWVRALPDGLDTRVGELAHALTPAQAQQLALTRVLLHDPVVVVLDEATADAGSAGAADLDAAALEVTRGRAALVVAHRLSQARAADRIVVMDAGRIVEQGTHDELVAAGGRYARLWQAWSR